MNSAPAAAQAPLADPIAVTPIARVRPLPLHAHSILRHAAKVHRDATVTSVSPTGSTACLTYAQLAEQAQHYGAELKAHGIGVKSTLINMGVNSIEQLAYLYAALSVGATTHLMNPLLPPEQVLQLIAAARPALMLHDDATAQLVAAVSNLLPDLSQLKMGAVNVPSLHAPAAAPLDDFDENLPAIVCYSSGTTGLPKAAQYTHRSTVLHAWSCALPDAMALTAQDRVLPLMQQFHATAWGAPFVSPLVGASLILVPPSRDPKQWYEWIEAHNATVLGAVTSHWYALVQYMQDNKLRFSKLQRTVVGGTRLPETVARTIAEDLGVEVRHAWGMTETSPLATMERYVPERGTLRHGKPVFGIELCLGGHHIEGHHIHGHQIASNMPIGHLDELHVRGHWVAHRGNEHWLPTGDCAALHADGHLEVMDRMQDALSGSARFMSSSLVEFHARQVHGVADAALVRLDSGTTVLAWIKKPETDQTKVMSTVHQTLAEHFAGWTPDHVIALETLPYTHSSKIQKHLLKHELERRLQADPKLERRQK